MRRRWVLLTILAVAIILGIAAASFAMLRTGGETAEVAGGTSSTAVENSDSSDPPEAPTSDEAGVGNGEDVGAGDPAQSERETIALEAARIMTTWTPRQDTTATAAEKRATKYMTDERAEKVLAPQRPTTGEQWLQAAEQNATSEPQVEILRGTEAGTIAVEARWTWVTDDGHVVAPSDQRRIYYFTFTEGEDPKISDYTWELRQD